MTKQCVLLALALCFGAASCAKNAAPKNQATGSTSAAPAGVDVGKVADAAKAANPAAPAAPSIPSGAEWTIYCTTVPGAGHVVQATQLRDQLAKSTGMRDWYVIHGADESTL